MTDLFADGTISIHGAQENNLCFEGHPKDSLNDKNSRTGAALAAIIS